MAGEWLAQLPDDLKTNEAFTSYATLGDLAKAHLEATGKLSESDGKLSELREEYDGFMENAIPKLPDDATDEERNVYFQQLGRPETASEYEFDGEDKNAPEWTNYWKEQFHSLGLTKSQAKTLSSTWNAQMQKMVEAHNVSIQNEAKEAETKLRNELGEKFDTYLELAKRTWAKYGEGDFDKAFDNGNSAYRISTIRMLLKFARLTGEDNSPMGGKSVNGQKPSGFITYDKSPAPPNRP